MAKGSTEKTERNNSLARDYMARNSDGSWTFSIAQLSGKYDISATFIHRKMSDMGVPRRKVFKKKKDKKA